MDSMGSDAFPTVDFVKGQGVPTDDGAPWTLVGAFFANAKSFSDRVAFRAKERGIWRTWTYQAAAEESGRVAAGMSKLGVSRGDHVGIIGPNDPRLYMAILASQTIAAVPVVFHPNVVPSEIVHHNTVQGLRLVFGIDLSGTGPVRSALADSTGCIATVVVEPNHTQHIDHDKTITYGSIFDEGGEVIESQRDWLEKAISGLSDTDLALKSVASGSDGAAREIALNHAMIRRAIEVVSPVKAFDEGEDALAFLPMSHYADQLQFFCAVTSATTINTPESTLTVFADIRDISPTVLVATPPIYAKFRALHEDRISLASRLMQSIISKVMASAERAAMNQDGTSLLGRIGRWLLLNPIRRQMGFGSVKVAISTQSALPEHLREFFGALGVTFTELYGKAEYAGALAISNGRSFPANNRSLNIDENGRLLALVDARAALCLPNYAEPLDQAKEATCIETGDVATYRDGTWSVAGRLDHRLELEDGTSLQPEPIEQRVADTPFIRAVVLLGHNRQQLTAVILPTMDRLSHWARQEAVSFANTAELLDNAKTKDLFRSLISNVNSGINTANDGVRINQILLLPDNTPYLTRHGGVRRRKFAEAAASPAAGVNVVS